MLAITILYKYQLYEYTLKLILCSFYYYFETIGKENIFKVAFLLFLYTIKKVLAYIIKIRKCVTDSIRYYLILKYPKNIRILVFML